MYPPVWVLSYFPVVMAKSPNGVVMLGRVLALTYSMAPVVLLCFRGSPSKRISLFAVAAFVFLAIELEGVRYSCFDVAADAPSLGFALAACAVMVNVKDHSRRSFLFCLAATLAWLAVWSKQVMLPIIPALAVWVLLSQGLRSFALFCACAIGIGAIISTAMSVSFPPDGLLLNLVTIPARCPWTGESPFVICRVLKELLAQSLGLVVFLLAGAVILFYRRGDSRPLQWLTSKSWAWLRLSPFGTSPCPSWEE